MDISISKKREGIPNDIPSNHIKRFKVTQDGVILFISSLSNLAEWKKVIVRNLEFASLLQFSCTSDVSDIFDWLVQHFNPATAIFTFESGFSFALSPSIVQIILGIPSGKKPLLLKTTKDACNIIHEIVHMENPSVEHLCSLLSEELDELPFSHIFLLAATFAFLAPNGRGVTSSRYYHAIIDYISSPDHDWCSFTLHWLILYIKKYIDSKRKGIIAEAGGCKIIPVIAYFEFQITSKFNLGMTVPRLPLWSNHIVNSYIALDSVQGSAICFGRLSRKHISSTPFKETEQIVKFKMPSEVQEYIYIKSQGLSYMEKQKLESMAQLFFNDFVQSSVATMKSFINGITELMSSQHLKNVKEEPVESEKHELIVHRSPRVTSNPKVVPDIEALQRDLFAKDSLLLANSIKSVSDQIHQSLWKSCTLQDTKWDFDLPPVDSKFEESLLPQFLPIAVPSQFETSLNFTEFLQDTLREMYFQEKQAYQLKMKGIINQKIQPVDYGFLTSWCNNVR